MKKTIESARVLASLEVPILIIGDMGENPGSDGLFDPLFPYIVMYNIYTDRLPVNRHCRWRIRRTINADGAWEHGILRIYNPWIKAAGMAVRPDQTGIFPWELPFDLFGKSVH